jgi:hypothetical protein
MASTQSFIESCAQHNRRSRWAQETAPYCWGLCYRHSGATSSSNRVVAAEARPSMRARLGCRAKWVGRCTSVVEIGTSIKAAFASLDSDQVLCIAWLDNCKSESSSSVQCANSAMSWCAIAAFGSINTKPIQCSFREICSKKRGRIH